MKFEWFSGIYKQNCMDTVMDFIKIVQGKYGVKYEAKL